MTHARRLATPKAQPDDPDSASTTGPEAARLADNGDGKWWHWGPYLSERQWGTVREDYSADGDAWSYLPHDHARSRAYRWGEDGIAGLSDERQLFCISLALWNGKDPILKERFFGLTNSEGNHGEDVKELYYFVDALPSHSYLRMLYKYPQAEFPYRQLVEENSRRGPELPEYELLDTGIFDDDRYFDVVVEYAKAGPEEILMRVTATNRGPDEAELHLLPQVTLRNTWAWQQDSPRPGLSRTGGASVSVTVPDLGDFVVEAAGKPRLLFTENESNAERLWGAAESGQKYCKDAFHEWLVDGRKEAVNPAEEGTRMAFHWRESIPSGESRQVRLLLRHEGGTKGGAFDDFDDVFADRIAEADSFYRSVGSGKTEEERRVERGAWAGLIWNKQTYHYNVRKWLRGDPAQPAPPAGRRTGRNSSWQHLDAFEVLSMPDCWEFPWFAAWDLAFHTVPFARIDAAFSKHQLDILTREWYLHPNGQLPAYEWAFGDVNPPVHAWAAWRVFQIDRDQQGGKGDRAFLERVFHKLLLNFTWWVNRKDPEGHNLFEGGFLGLDNIGLFNRSAPLPTGGDVHQADGTSWMAMYSLNLLRIALELAREDSVYQDIATKFFEHFLAIAEAMTAMGTSNTGLWDEQDQFYYDVLHLPDGHELPLRVRSMVGLIPLFAVEVLEHETLEGLPDFTNRLEWFLAHRPDLAKLVSRWNEPGQGDRRLLSLLRGHRMKRLLARMLDETEFLSPHGVRSMSRHHLDDPYTLTVAGRDHVVCYEPGVSESRLYGGNSNWRGPVWFPVNFLIVESLLRFHSYYGDDFRIECPTGSGQYTSIEGVARELAGRLVRLFLPDEKGQRPASGSSERLQSDPNFNNHLMFNEFFHGDTGAGLGASHQTGWTALVTELMRLRGSDDES